MVVRVPILAALIAVMAGSSGASAKTEALRAVATALELCMDGKAPPPAASATAVPPGLISGLRDLSAAPLPASGGTAFSYQGRLGGAEVCGMAVYGRVDGRVRREIRKVIAGHTRFTAAAPSSWTVTAPPAKAEYWGDRHAPGLMGVLWLERPKSAAAPTVDVHYHVVLVR